MPRDFREIEDTLSMFFASEGARPARAAGDLFVGAVEAETDVRQEKGHLVDLVLVDGGSPIKIVNLTELAKMLADE